MATFASDKKGSKSPAFCTDQSDPDQRPAANHGLQEAASSIQQDEIDPHLCHGPRGPQIGCFCIAYPRPTAGCESATCRCQGSPTATLCPHLGTRDVAGLGERAYCVIFEIVH